MAKQNWHHPMLLDQAALRVTMRATRVFCGDTIFVYE
jgi:hypothetical protein